MLKKQGVKKNQSFKRMKTLLSFTLWLDLKEFCWHHPAEHQHYAVLMMKLYKLNIYNYLLTKHDETKMDLQFLKFFGKQFKI